MIVNHADTGVSDGIVHVSQAAQGEARTGNVATNDVITADRRSNQLSLQEGESLKWFNHLVTQCSGAHGSSLHQISSIVVN